MADAEIVKDVNNSPVSQPAADSITTPVAPGTDAENPESSVPPVPNTSTHTDEDAQIAPVTAAEGISSIPESSTNGQDVEMADEPAVQSVVLSAEAVKDHEEPMVDDAMQIDRPLNVTDALSYLDAVKNKFSTRPDVYNHFLDIMKEFKSQQIDTPGVIKRVSALFQGHHSLIQGFNTFLPVGYRIECSSDANHITVTTPRGTKMETTGSGGGKPFHWSDELEPHSPVPHPLKHPEHREPRMLPSSRRETPDISLLQSPQAMEPAVAYVQKIKQRCDPETYRQFLDILSCYHHSPESINEEEVSKQISQLFKDAPDLRSDFRIFMPDGSQSVLDDNAAAEEGRHHHHRGRDHHHRERDHHDSKSRRKADAAENASLLPQKRKRKAGDRESIASTRVEREKLPVKQTTSSKSKKAKTENARPNTLSSTISNQTTIAAGPSSARIPTSAPLPHTSSFDPSHFFDRVKRALDSRETYNEFLKVVNLFTQGYIDTARLVQESRNFLVGDGELMRGWKEILGWDGRKEESESWGDADGWNRLIVVDEVIERPVPVPGKVDLSAQYGSYRRLPESEINVTCSGRDSMCRDVLNDEWVSHPTWALNSSSYGSASTSNNSSGNITYPDPFDDPTFFWAVSRKNVYEEALHRSEEERHEYDFHIEAISRTIAILEPINNKISQLSPEERGGFRLKPNLGGSAKAIHQRVVRKIYGRDVGTEVLACMQESPAHAVPVVLSRLKQKEEEWKRAQREWNKVWREVDARNYAKSLDHQSVNFKAADKKLLTTKAFVNEIEAAREEQMASRASLMDPLFSRTRPRHQLEIPFEDLNVLQDSLKLVFSFLDRTQGQINWNERRRIEAFLRGLVPLMFMIDASAFNAAFAAVQESSGADGEMDVEGLGLLDVEAQVATSSRSGGGRNKKGGGAGVSGGDLRKKLLKSEQAKSGRKTRGAVVQQASPSVSRFASPAPHATGEGASKIIPTTNRKRGVFFTNTTFYVLLRLLGVLYSRLRLFKSIGAQLYEDARHYPSDTRSPVHDIAVTTSGPTSSTLSNVRAREREGSSGSEQPGDTDINMDAASSSMFLPTQQKIEGLENLHSEPERIAVAAQSYDVLLQNCERLFDNEIEQSAFEDQMRSMFGIKARDAYKIFTIDKLIGVIIKQVQLIFADPKSQDLLEILKRDRAVASPTSQDQINNRRNAEKVLGPDENLFRIDWLTESRCLTIQLIGKDDTSYDDSEVLTGRWQTYIDSYVANESTKGIAPQKVKRPFLKRNLPKPEILSEPDIVGNDALEIKVCVRTYRLFYVSDTEDYLWAARKRDHYTAILPSLRKRQQSRSAWIERSRTELPQVSDVEGTGTASTPAVAETKIIVGTQEKIEASREIDKNLSPTSTSAT